jgi:thiamine-phosphate pyrophosphorylase
VPAEDWRAQLELIRLACQSGCQLVQLREKDVPARKLASFTREAVAVTRPHGARVLVNDRLDVALAAGADGVHLRTTSMPVRDVRRVVAHARASANSIEFLIGVSTHSLAQVEAAAAEGADFVVCGPVFAPNSKTISTPLLGLEGLAEVCRRATLPVLALGGISPENFRATLDCGAAGIAAVGLFQDANRLRSHIKMMLSFNAKPQNKV